MNDYCKKAISKLDEHLNFIALEIENPILRAETAVNSILQSIENVKKFILKRRFQSEQEEIHFFKNLKPKFVSKLVYYHTIYHFEMHRPYVGNKSLQKYIQKELDELKRFFDNNLDFYKYYRSESNYLDFKYFVRGTHDIKLTLDSFYFEADKNFCTTHDFKIAKILANDLIQLYLQCKLKEVSNNVLSKEMPLIAPKGNLKWTENKTDLIELIYGLHALGVFENGKAEIKDIAKYFESIFNIELGDYYRTYLELRSRKITKTKFIDTLRENLHQRMTAQDE